MCLIPDPYCPHDGGGVLGEGSGGGGGGGFELGVLAGAVLLGVFPKTIVALNRLDYRFKCQCLQELLPGVGISYYCRVAAFLNSKMKRSRMTFFLYPEQHGALPLAARWRQTADLPFQETKIPLLPGRCKQGDRSHDKRLLKAPLPNSLVYLV